MSGLTADLNVAMQSLMANTASMNVTTTNISNMNTPGYARRRVVLEEAAPVGTDGGTTGVDIKSIQSLRNNVLELSINAATSQQNQSSTIANSLSATEVLFSDTASSSVGSTIDTFFSSLQQLSTSPSTSSLRSNVLTAASNVASAFQKTAAALTDSQKQMDQNVIQSTSDINSLLQQIANANDAITTAQNLGQLSNSAEDQRSALLSELSGIVGYKMVNGSDGVTLTTDNGIPLVVGNKAYALTNSLSASGFNEVNSGGVDITSTIEGGNLGGFLQARDQSLATMKTQLDQFAFQFAQTINNIQAAGSTLDGTATTGTSAAAIFNPPNTTTGSATGAASSISSALTSGSQLAAAATGGASGDNSNLAKMIALQNQTIINGSTPTTAFADLTFSIGNTISQATSNATATGSILTQLQNQRGAISGVSLDEESANLLLYQRSFQAAAKIITIVDTLMGELLNMGVA